MKTSYPIVANCNYGSADDTTIHDIRRAIDNGTLTDEATIEAMDQLEEVLTKDACDQSADAVQRCEAAEAAVLEAWSQSEFDR